MDCIALELGFADDDHQRGVPVETASVSELKALVRDILVRASLAAPAADAAVRTAQAEAGRMLAFRWKILSGSYFALMAANRAYLSAPYAARTRSS